MLLGVIRVYNVVIFWDLIVNMQYCCDIDIDDGACIIVIGGNRSIVATNAILQFICQLASRHWCGIPSRPSMAPRHPEKTADAIPCLESDRKPKIISWNIRDPL